MHSPRHKKMYKRVELNRNFPRKKELTAIPFLYIARIAQISAEVCSLAPELLLVL